MSAQIRMLVAGDEDILRTAADGVFDGAVSANLSTEFLSDPRHRIAVAVEAGVVVGFASAVCYFHPDKPLELWINEVGVAASHQRQGLARRLLLELFETARSLGCGNAWVLTEAANEAAVALYASMPGARLPREQLMFEFDLERAKGEA